jgi:DNA polymerase
MLGNRQFVSLDVETHSTVNLTHLGAEVYTRDPSTDILLLAWHAVDAAGPPRIWIKGWPPPTDLFRMIQDEAVICGWNVIGFDRLIWSRVLVPRYGFPPIPDDNWRDSMHYGAAANLPRALAGCAKSLGIQFEENLKDQNQIRRITDKKRTPVPSKEDLEWLAARCLLDVQLEEEVLKRLPAGLDVEPWNRMAALDRKINDRGIQVDIPLVEGLAKAAQTATKRLGDELAEITEGEVTAITKVAALKIWLMKRGVVLPKKTDPGAGSKDEYTDPIEEAEEDDETETSYRLRKSDIADLLARDDVPEDCRRALEIRVEAAKASVAKLKKIGQIVGADGRIRAQLIFYGAQATGRFSSTQAQVHNMVRDVIGNEDEVAQLNGLNAKTQAKELERAQELCLQQAIQAGCTGDVDLIEFMFTMTRKDNQNRVRVERAMMFISRMLRRTITATPGRTLLQGDYSQIEARIPMWLAGQEDKVQVFVRGEDIYRATAAPLFGKQPEDITTEERQIGKVCIAEDSLVLTDQGLVPIQNVTLDMKLWDGISWVSHDGPVFNGYKEVIEYDGLCATPDHEIWIEGQSRSLQFGDAAAMQAKLVRSEYCGAPVRICGNYIQRNPSGCNWTTVRSDALYSVSGRTMDLFLQPENRPFEGLPELFTASSDTFRTDKASIDTPRSKSPMRASGSQALSQLRGSGHRVSVSLGSEGEGVGIGEFGFTKTSTDRVGPDRQQWSLRAGQFTLGNPSTKSYEPANYAMADLQGYESASDGCYSRHSDTAAELPVCRQYHTPATGCLREYRGAVEEDRSTSNIHKTTRPVWDILNAGPRHRFTVSGHLVSNCSLFLGFAGGVNAFVPAAMNYGMRITRAQAEPIVKGFRETNSMLTAFWDNSLACARMAIENPGHVYTVPPKWLISWCMVDNCLMCRLPSGRILRYWGARLVQGYWADGTPKMEPDISIISVKGKAVYRRTLWRGLAIENCLTAQSKVITCHGIKNLIDVKDTDLLWDGAAWVSHLGVVSQGIKSTIDFGGVNLTADHKVDLACEWRECGRTTYDEAASSYARHYWYPNRSPYGHSFSWNQWPASCMVDPMRLRERKINAVTAIFSRWCDFMWLSGARSQEGAEAATPDTRPVKASRLCGMALNERPLQTANTSIMAQLRWSRNNSLRRVAGQFREFLARHGALLRQGFNSGATRKLFRLQQRELRVGDTSATIIKQTEQRVDRNTLGPNDDCRSFTKERDKRDDIVLSNSSRNIEPISIYETRSPEPVYDILNAGPNHRFTVMGDDGRLILVSNCVQAIAADMLVTALDKMDRAGFDLVLHVHDSIEAEEDIRFAEEKLVLFKQCMLDVPVWAAGLPVAAKCHIGERFG